MPHTKPFLIAIDGPNASGKGTLARALGAELGFPVLDTGLLYRAVGFLMRERGDDLRDENAALHAADDLHELITPEFLSNEDLRSSESGTAASIVSAHPPVRQSLFDLQRNFALHPPGGAKGAILDGRDIGTVICPDAHIKFFVTAQPEIRAERRARELYDNQWQDHFDELLKQTIERDKRDSERATAPLKAASDAIHIDTSHMTAKEVLAMAKEAIQAKMAEIAVK